MQAKPWQQVDTEGNVFRAQYKADMGKPYSLLVRLAEDSFIVYSPGPGLIDSASDLIPAESKIILLAPAAGHTLGLECWSTHFRNSRVVASATTREKLLKKASLTDIENIESADSLPALLPAHVRAHVLPDNGFGEIWISIETPESGGTIYWAVCDAFMNLDKITGSLLARIFMKLYGLRTGLMLHRVFKLGVKNKSDFRQWALERFPNDKKNILIPCHGDIYDAPDLSERIASMVKENF